MWVNRTVVITKPESIRRAKLKIQSAWVRRAALRAVWDLRRRVIKETGQDILGIIDNPGNIVVNINGDLDARSIYEDGGKRVAKRPPSVTAEGPNP